MNEIVSFERWIGHSPLSVAVCIGEEAMVKLLLKHARSSSMDNLKPRNPLPPNTKKGKDNTEKYSFFSTTNGRIKKMQRPNKRRKKTSTTRKEFVQMEGNNGYYIFIHDDSSSQSEEGKADDDDEEGSNFSQRNINQSGNLPASFLDDIPTPEGMDNLEWDLEVIDPSHGDADIKILDKEEEAWSKQYAWYAEILSKTKEIVGGGENEGGEWEGMNSKVGSSDVNEQKSQILRGCLDINLQDSRGKTAAHYAAERGHVKILKLLFEAGAELDIGDRNNLTPLHLASYNGHLSIVKYLIQIYGGKGGRGMVNRKTATDKLTPLHYASTRGFSDIAQVLIESGAIVDALDSADRTPLKLAASRDRADVAKVLIQAGAKVNLEDVKGYTPLYEAVWQKSVEMVSLLFSSGARVTPAPNLLHYVVLHRHIEMAELLLKNGSLVNLRGPNNDSPLMLAAKTSQPEMAKLLIKHGAKVNFMGEVSPLSYAKGVKVVRVLVEGGADVNSDHLGAPLINAIRQKEFDIASLLLSYGAFSVPYSISHNGMKINTLLQTAKLCDAPLSLFKKMVQSGITINESICKEVINECSEYPQVKKIKWLLYQVKTPLSLSQLTRIKIRRLSPGRGGRDLIRFVNSLGLPQSLVRYLLMEDDNDSDLE